ncbi:MAG: hypothetical protein GF350_01395, partial [Chitinivibrionales bacterium]|nr:hypothetical protein [Chitinivibrionales bacterium]
WRDANDDGDCEDAGDEKLYYCNDANMNVTAVVDGDSGNVVERYAYDPYGKPHIMDASFGSRSSSSYDNEILYCGYRFDPETGLYSVRFRYYLWHLGRWGSRDPAGYTHTRSLYSYASGDPIGFRDPLGKKEKREKKGKPDYTTAKEIYEKLNSPVGQTVKTAAEEISKETATTGKPKINPDLTPKSLAGVLNGLATSKGWEGIDALVKGLERFSTAGAPCRSWMEDSLRRRLLARDPTTKVDPCYKITNGLRGDVTVSRPKEWAGECLFDLLEKCGDGHLVNLNVAKTFLKFANHIKD